MKKMLLLVTLLACQNNAITIAHQIAPDADCKSVNTSYSGQSHDQAVCTVDDEVWSCDEREMKCVVIGHTVKPNPEHP